MTTLVTGVEVETVTRSISGQAHDNPIVCIVDIVTAVNAVGFGPNVKTNNRTCHLSVVPIATNWWLDEGVTVEV